MNKLDKLKLVLNLIKEHNITAYEISKNTKISSVGIQKIINGETKNPNENTLNLILDYLENSIKSTNVNESSVNESNENKYKTNVDLSIEYKKCLENSIDQLKQIDYLKSLLRKNNIEFDE